MTSSDSATKSTFVIWAWVPALLLGSMLLGVGSMAYVAIDDPHFALEPNYYDKALHWDRSQAEARESEAVGLKLDLSPLTLSSTGRVKLELRVADHRGLALPGAEVRVEAFPNAYANQLQELVLTETSPGVYEAELTRGLRGLWELRFSVKQGKASYREVLRRDVLKGDAA